MSHSSSFDLDLANNLEVEFLVYSWDPQLRHRLCYRSSLRLSTLFGKGQSFQQVALRLVKSVPTCTVCTQRREFYLVASSQGCHFEIAPQGLCIIEDLSISIGCTRPAHST